MTDAWWNISAAAQYLAARRPCNSIYHAQHLLSCWIEDGTLPTRCWLEKTGVALPIDPHEWRREDGQFELKWEGWGRLPEDYMGFTELQVDAIAVQRLCAPQPGHKGAGGRPPKPAWDIFYARVIHLAEHPDGLPDDPAELRRAMLEWCDENIPDALSETSIREKIKTIYELRKTLGNNSR